MTGSYEGDIIRPLGLVTLYAAYAEREIDALIRSLSALAEPDGPKQGSTVGQKLILARQLVDGLPDETLAGLKLVLEESIKLFDRRNALVHNAIFSSTSVVESRVTGQEQAVSAEALTTLAEEIFAAKERICAFRQRSLEPLLADMEARNSG